jgi:formyltetrahydrofolate deformylase
VTQNPSDAPAEGDASRFLLTVSCDDRPGIVYAVSSFLVQQQCTIVQSQQYGDPDTGRFFLRVAFDSVAGGRSLDGLRSAFSWVGDSFQMTWDLRDADVRPRVLIMVSRQGHCLNDLLFRHSTGTLPVDIVAVVSNHTDFAALTGGFGIPFHHVPVTPETKGQAEQALLDLVAAEQVDLVVLARYMQVLSDGLCRALEGRAINIHHSFLPSFKGARPYHQAHDRGVKMIGATAHYVTADLDEGPIIEQEVERVDHAFDVADLVRTGHDVEALVLARAVRWHAERRVLLNGRSTVVFR